MRVVITRVGSVRLASVGAAALLTAMAVPSGATPPTALVRTTGSAAAAETAADPAAAPKDLAALRNNVGIDQGPNSAANFDDGGYSYSFVALAAAGIRGGTQIAADGLTYTWPTTSSGQPDNVVVRGQALKVDVPAGSTRLGLLAAATNGAVDATFTAVYRDAAAVDGVHRVALPVSVSDWTLGGGTTAPSPGNTVAVTSAFRSSTLAPELVDTNVFSVVLPLDASKELLYVQLPAEYGDEVSTGLIHLFDVKTGR